MRRLNRKPEYVLVGRDIHGRGLMAICVG